jgi:hypothetical protein
MKKLFIPLLLVLFVSGCIPGKDGNTSTTTDVLVDTITECLGSAVEQGLTKEALESCISSSKGNLTNIAITKLKQVLVAKFSSDTLTKLMNLFFGVPDDNAIIPDNDADKIDTILIKIRALKQ